MTNRSPLLVIVLFILPLGVATWILASHTVGEAMSPGNTSVIGFSVSLLTVAALVYLFFLSKPPDRITPQIGMTLIICGTLCILFALALQFYLASVTAANTQRVAELLSQGLRTGPSANVNLNINYPESVKSLGYFALFAGIWLAALGIRLGVGREAVSTPRETELSGLS